MNHDAFHAGVLEAPRRIEATGQASASPHFHKMFARSQNALRGRWENLWSSEQVCVVRLIDRDDVIDKLVYTATKPVKMAWWIESTTGPESTGCDAC